jgi:serine protease Do
MVEPGSPLLAFSDHAAELVERVASSIVAVDGGGRWPSSGIHWRSGVIITAEEVLERDENIKLTLPGGRVANASLAGRDPTTDVAVLRFQPDGLPVATTAEAPLRAGQVVVVVGNHEARRSSRSASSLSRAGFGTAFAAVPSTGLFALT